MRLQTCEVIIANKFLFFNGVEDSVYRCLQTVLVVRSQPLYVEATIFSIFCVCFVLDLSAMHIVS